MRLLDGLGHEMWVSADKQKPLYAPEESDPELPFTFNGYGAAGSVKVSAACLLCYLMYLLA